MSEKPPTQGIGVEGIASAKQEISQSIDWSRLVTLPPFQMFSHEKAKLPIGEIDGWIHSFVMGEVAKVSEQAFFDEYVTWHDAKGYWPDETPTGELRG